MLVMNIFFVIQERRWVYVGFGKNHKPMNLGSLFVLGIGGFAASAKTAIALSCCLRV